MDLSSLHSLHLETAVLVAFLSMALLAQLGRARDAGRRVPTPRLHFLLFLSVFGFAAAACLPLLYSVSPVLALELAAGFTLALMHPVNALCFFVHLLFLRPWEIAPGNAFLLALPRLLAATCAVSWLIHADARATPSPSAMKGLAALLAFSGWLFLSTFAAPDAAAAQADWFNSYFKAVIVFIMCLYFLKERRDVAEFKKTIVVSVLGLVLMALFEFFAAPPVEGAPRRLQPMRSVLDPNDLAAVTIMALPLLLGPAFRGAAGLGRKAWAALLGAAALAAVWYSQSRGAFIALFVQALGARYLKDIGRRWLGALALGLLLSVGYWGLMKAVHRSQEDMGASSESRLIYWKTAVRMAVRHPLSGVGYGEYPRNYEAYSSDAKYEWGLRTAHSTWLLAFAESGVVGGCLLLGFFVLVWRTAWRRRGERPDPLYSLLGYGAAMSFLSHTYLLYPYILAGLILASDAVREAPHAA